MERLQGIHLLAGGGELDGTTRNGLDGDSCTAAGIIVQFGDDDACQPQLFMEAVRHIHGLLAGHGIHHKQNFVRYHGLLNLRQLFHQRFVDMETSGGIDQNVIMPVFLGVGNALFGDVHRIDVRAGSEYRHLQLFAQNLQLLDGGRPVNIRGHHQRAVVLLLQILGQLAGGGGFPCALQTGHQDDCRRTVGPGQLGLSAAHQSGQLFVDDIHNHHARGEAFHYFLADGAFPDPGNEILDDLKVYVSLQKSQTHLS
ncbi:hypothetical protein D3C75_595710 [compost metagenome]